MGKNIIHLAAGFLQIPPGRPVFSCTRHFLRPPGAVLFPELLIFGAGAAHDEERPAVQRIDLPAHQVDYAVSKPVRAAAVPHGYGLGVQLSVIPSCHPEIVW